MFLKNSTNKKCACKNLLGPPPVYLLEPPPMPPLPLDLDNILISNTNDLERVLKCPRSIGSLNQIQTVSTRLNQTNRFNYSNLFLNTSHFFIVIVIIVILIVFLLLFILFAFIIVHLTRLKLNKSQTNLKLDQSQSSSQAKQESQQTVSVLSLTSPSLSHLSGDSLHTSPNSSSSAEDRNLVVVDHQTAARLQTFNLNSFSKPPNTIFNLSSSSTCSSTASPNKQSITNESIETSRTNSTFLTVNSRPNRPKVSKFAQAQQSDPNQQHYYESIGDMSQLYFDVDDPGIKKAQFEYINANSRHYPITCCSCTLIKLNQSQNNAHSVNCSTFLSQEQQQQVNLTTNPFFNPNNNQIQQHQVLQFNQNVTNSNLNPEQYYLKSLIV